MYTENDYQLADARVRRVMVLMLAPAAVLLGGVIWSFVVRIKWLTILLSVLTGCWIVFIRQNYLVPEQAYRRHIHYALHAPKKEAEGVYLRTESTPVERENVLFFAFYLNVGEKNDPEDDRLFYLDARRPLPAWQAGERLHVTSYDKFVSGYRALDAVQA